MAEIQGRLPFTSPRQSRDRRGNNYNINGNGQQRESQTYSAAATGNVWRGRLSSPHRGSSNCQLIMNHHSNSNRFNHSRAGGHHRQTHDGNPIITGTSTNSSLRAAPPGGNSRQSLRDGLYSSLLSRNTRAIDVMNYIRNEANLNIRCDPIATRFDTYRSYYIHAAPGHHALLLRPGMWPRYVPVKKFNQK